MPLCVETQILLALVNACAPEEKVFVQQPLDDANDDVRDGEGAADEEARHYCL